MGWWENGIYHHSPKPWFLTRLYSWEIWEWEEMVAFQASSPLICITFIFPSFPSVSIIIHHITSVGDLWGTPDSSLFLSLISDTHTFPRFMKFHFLKVLQLTLPLPGSGRHLFSFLSWYWNSFLPAVVAVAPFPSIHPPISICGTKSEITWPWSCSVFDLMWLPTWFDISPCHYQVLAVTATTLDLSTCVMSPLSCMPFPPSIHTLPVWSECLCPPPNPNPNPLSDGIGRQDHCGVIRVEPFLNETGALIKEAPEMLQENSIETCILSRVKQITSPGWMHETSARTWCTGKT